jgi:ornithine cyclodeaminase
VARAAAPAPGRLLCLSRSDVARLGGEDPDLYVEAVRRALVLHARGETVLPLKPYLRGPDDNHVADRIIAMPGFLGGDKPVAGLKWIGSRHDNPQRRLERASGVVVLNDPLTKVPLALVEAGLISGMRTAAVTVLAAEVLAVREPDALALVGCGFIGRLQATSLLARFPSLRTVHLFDLDGAAARRLARELEGGAVSVEVAASAEACVRAGSVVVTATVASEPYVEADWLSPGMFVSNVSLMDLTEEALLAADMLVVDDWEQCNREGKTIHRLAQAGLLSRESIHGELGALLDGRVPGRERDDEIAILNPMGLAIEDLAAAAAIYERAVAEDVGRSITLY